jgi:hypothetical protein
VGGTVYQCIRINDVNRKIVKLITYETESEVTEMSSWDQANRGGKLGLVWRSRKKISQITNDYTFTYRSSSYLFYGKNQTDFRFMPGGAVACDLLLPVHICGHSWRIYPAAAPLLPCLHQRQKAAQVRGKVVIILTVIKVNERKLFRGFRVY